MSALKNLLSKLEDKYGESCSLIHYFSEKYGVAEETAEFNPMFTEDYAANKEKMEFIRDKFQSSRIEPSTEVEGKLLDKYEKELSKILSSDNFEDGEKVAKKLKNILKKTIVKLWSYECYKKWIQSYFESIGIVVKNFEKGHKLTNDDLTYLSAELMSAKKTITKDKSQDYEVIAMDQPIFMIGYEDDGEDEYACIEGICKYYLYER